MRKSLESELKETDERFRFLQAHPHPMWIFDHESLKFLEVNPAAIKKYGYSRREFLRMDITDIRPKKHVAQLLATHKRFRMGTKHMGEWQHMVKDGRLIDVEITAYPVYFCGQRSVLVQAQDVTDRKHAQDALRKLAIVEERNRIAREIHDTLAQAFTGILIQLEAAQDVLETSRSKTKAHIVRARSLARESLLEARRSVWELRPRILEKGGLAAAIKHLLNQSDFGAISFHYSMVGKPHLLSKEIEGNVFRICQEALTNTIQHSYATKFNIKLVFQKKNLQITMQDNGRGFKPEDYEIGFGLISMRERAQRMNANLRIESYPGRGTKIQLNVPIKSKNFQ